MRPATNPEAGGTFRKRLRPAALAILLVLPASPLLAVKPMPPYSQYPCATSTTNCQGGSVTTDLQTKVTERSSRSSCGATDTYGNCIDNFQGRTCPTSSQWCQSPAPPNEMGPSILGINHTAAGTGYVQLDVEYDFPNNYCQTWDPPASWPIPCYHNTILEVVNGPTSPAVFEHDKVEAHDRLYRHAVAAADGHHQPDARMRHSAERDANVHDHVLRPGTPAGPAELPDVPERQPGAGPGRRREGPGRCLDRAERRPGVRREPGLRPARAAALLQR